MDQAEDHLVFAAGTDRDRLLDEDQAKRLLSLPARVTNAILDLPVPASAETFIAKRQTEIQRSISARNARFYEAEADKLDGWADDLKVGLEREIKEFDRLIKEARRAATTALTLEEKLAGQKQIKILESDRNAKRRSLFEAQDAIDSQREELIGKIERKLQQAASLAPLFSLRWNLS